MPKTNVKVELTGTDGNAFAILGKVRVAMKRAGVPAETIEAYTKEATSGDYDHLLATSMEYVDVSLKKGSERPMRLWKKPLKTGTTGILISDSSTTDYADADQSLRRVPSPE